MARNYFKDCLTVEAVKAAYKELMKKHHPDKGGDREICKTINAQMDDVLRGFVQSGFAKFSEDKKRENANWKSPFVDISKFSDILSQIISEEGIKIEIIGFWIYVFGGFGIKDKLKDLGFWYSAKHKAWIYSGGKKRRIRTSYTTDDNRSRWGSQEIEKEEPRKKIASK